MLRSDSKKFWVTQSAWIHEPPPQEEMTKRGSAIMVALGKDPRFTSVAVMTNGVTDELAGRMKSGESDDRTITELTMTGVITAFGVLDASMRAAPAFMEAFQAGTFGDGWEWSQSKVKLLAPEAVDA